MSYRKYLLYEHFRLISQNKLSPDCAVLKQVGLTPPPPSKSHWKNRMSPTCSLKAAQLLNCSTQRRVMGGRCWTAQMLLLLTKLLIASAVITCCFLRHLEWLLNCWAVSWFLTRRYSDQSKPQGPHQPLTLPEMSLTADILMVALVHFLLKWETLYL